VTPTPTPTAKAVKEPPAPPDAIRKLLVTIKCPGNPKKCCGKNAPHTKFAIAFVVGNEVTVTKIYESNLKLMAEHGKWAGAISSTSPAIRSKVIETLKLDPADHCIIE
jgi:hypothetical protein